MLNIRDLLVFAGTIYSSSLFPNRAPSGRVLLLNYIGGATNTGILSKVRKILNKISLVHKIEGNLMAALVMY